jgi:putative transposase
MCTSYKVRAYLTPEGAASNRTFGCVRLVWNKVLAWRQARYRTEGIATCDAETDRYLTRLKRDPGLGFLSEVSSVPLQQALRHQHTAFGLQSLSFRAGRSQRSNRWYTRRSPTLPDLQTSLHASAIGPRPSTMVA